MLSHISIFIENIDVPDLVSIFSMHQIEMEYLIISDNSFTTIQKLRRLYQNVAMLDLK